MVIVFNIRQSSRKVYTTKYNKCESSVGLDTLSFPSRVFLFLRADQIKFTDNSKPAQKSYVKQEEIWKDIEFIITSEILFSALSR